MPENAKQDNTLLGIGLLALAGGAYWYFSKQDKCEVESTEKCEGLDLYRCQGGKWVLVQKNASACMPVPPDQQFQSLSVQYE